MIPPSQQLKQRCSKKRVLPVLESEEGGSPLQNTKEKEVPPLPQRKRRRKSYRTPEPTAPMLKKR
jgi:hypothetical protein